MISVRLWSHPESLWLQRRVLTRSLYMFQWCNIVGKHCVHFYSRKHEDAMQLKTKSFRVKGFRWQHNSLSIYNDINTICDTPYALCSCLFNTDRLDPIGALSFAHSWLANKSQAPSIPDPVKLLGRSACMYFCIFAFVFLYIYMLFGIGLKLHVLC